MSIFAFGFNQTAQLSSYTGLSATGRAEYAAGVNIKCFFDYKRRETIDKDGGKAVSEATLYTTSQVKPLDHIDYGGRTWTVKSVAERRDLQGAIDHYEVTL